MTLNVSSLGFNPPLPAFKRHLSRRQALMLCDGPPRLSEIVPLVPACICPHGVSIHAIITTLAEQAVTLQLFIHKAGPYAVVVYRDK